MKGKLRLVITNKNRKEIQEYLKNKSGMTLPPLFLQFISTFEYPPLKPEKFKYSNGSEYDFTSFRYLGRLDEEDIDTTGFAKFLNLENLLGFYSDLIEYEEEDEDLSIPFNMGLLTIAVSHTYSHGGGIMLGTKGEFTDKILLDKFPATTDRFEILEENIFEFIKNIEAYTMPQSAIPFNIEIGNLHKNWGDELWEISH